ncbi:MAG: hypothetical protein JST48_09665 [Bacteroidetes bacterium]|nr:hypothetical protein [Bacteroidota bacterium]
MEQLPRPTEAETIIHPTTRHSTRPTRPCNPPTGGLVFTVKNTNVYNLTRATSSRSKPTAATSPLRAAAAAWQTWPQR